MIGKTASKFTENQIGHKDTEEYLPQILSSTTADNPGRFKRLKIVGEIHSKCLA